MIGLFFTITTVFTSYIIFLVCKFGILPSISESYYRLPKKEKILFIAFLWGIGMPFAVIAQDIYGFLVLAGLMFVGGASLFKRHGTSTVHYIGAAVAIVSGELYMALEANIWVLPALFVLGTIGLYKLKVKNYIWWIELLAFTTIIIGLGIKIF